MTQDRWFYGSKVGYAKRIAGKQLAAQLLARLSGTTVCLAWDGRKNDSNTILEKDSVVETPDGDVTRKVKVQCQVKEEHVPILAYPPGEYVDHLTLEHGDGDTQAEAYYEILKNLKSLETVRMVLCDGTTTV